MSIPKISVVIPSLNQGQFIERTLMSVLSQNYENLELIVVDGGSSDDTLQILAKHSSQIYKIISGPDCGQSDALNKGFAFATGEIFGWLNSDDLYLPGTLNRVATAFSCNPEKMIVYGDWWTIDENDKFLNCGIAFKLSTSQLKYEGFHCNAQSMFWRQAVHERFGLFNVTLHRTMDFEMIIRFAMNEGERSFLLLPSPLACFRRHPLQKTQGFDDIVAAEQLQIARQFNYLDKYERVGRFKRFYYRIRRAYWYVRRGAIPGLELSRFWR